MTNDKILQLKELIHSFVDDAFNIFVSEKKTFSSMEEYWKSDEWKALREKVKKRCNNVCELCKEERMYAVHHLHYKTLYNESLDDLQGVCRNCHDEAHGKKEIIPNGKFSFNCPNCNNAMFVEWDESGHIESSHPLDDNHYKCLECKKLMFIYCEGFKSAGVYSLPKCDCGEFYSIESFNGGLSRCNECEQYRVNDQPPPHEWYKTQKNEVFERQKGLCAICNINKITSYFHNPLTKRTLCFSEFHSADNIIGVCKEHAKLPLVKKYYE